MAIPGKGRNVRYPFHRRMPGYHIVHNRNEYRGLLSGSPGTHSLAGRGRGGRLRYAIGSRLKTMPGNDNKPRSKGRRQLISGESPCSSFITFA